MTEPLSRQRLIPSAARETRNGSAQSAHDDPLAELARLVGREDPFRDIFPARKHLSEERNAETETGHAASSYDTEPFADPEYRSQDEANGHSYNGSAHPGYADLRGRYDTPVDRNPEPRVEVSHVNSLRFPALTSGAHLPVEPQLEVQSGSADHDSSHLHPDLWAEGLQEPPPVDPAEGVAHPDADIEEPGRSRRRTLIVLIAVLALTGGGLAATFLARGGSHGSGAAASAPTILADTAPTKVQPPETANAATGGDGNTALLETSASDNVSNAKVVNTQEQPVDLNQLPKAASDAQVDARQGAAAGQPATAFPEPRRVKTVLIRPDGSVVGEQPASAPAAPAPAMPGLAMPGVAMPVAAGGAPDATASTPVAPQPVAKPATPKSTARATATPKTPPRAPAKPKPVETATAEPAQDAQDAPAAPAATAGAYAVQMAAPPSEAEAKSLSAQLQKKFAGVLGSRKLSIHEAKSGAKSVYRVRVGNLAQDDAKNLCSQLHTGGGSCFVVHN